VQLTSHSFKAIQLCRGRGVEIGALARPAELDAEVIYADVCDAATMTQVLHGLRGGPYYDCSKLVEPSIILQSPHYYLPIDNDRLDFVYSSHVLEHAPNPVAALYDQMRVVRGNGTVYFIVPNRRMTYDFRRPATSVDRLLRRFRDNDFRYDPADASELLWGSTGHAHYNDKTPERLAEIEATPGPHHYVVFTPASVLALVTAIMPMLNCEMIYFNAEDIHIHVALRKLGPAPV